MVLIGLRSLSSVIYILLLLQAITKENPNSSWLIQWCAKEDAQKRTENRESQAYCSPDGRSQAQGKGASPHYIHRLPLHCLCPLPLALPPTGSSTSPAACPGWIWAQFENFPSPFGTPSPPESPSALPRSGSLPKGLQVVSAELANWPALLRSPQWLSPSCWGGPARNAVYLQHILLWLRKLILHWRIQALYLWPKAATFVWYTPWSRTVILNPPKCLCACSHSYSITSATHVIAFTPYQGKPGSKYPSLDSQHICVQFTSLLPTYTFLMRLLAAIKLSQQWSLTMCLLITLFWKSRPNACWKLQLHKHERVHRLSVPSISLTP